METRTLRFDFEDRRHLVVLHCQEEREIEEFGGNWVRAIVNAPDSKRSLKDKVLGLEHSLRLAKLEIEILKVDCERLWKMSQ